MKRLFVFVAIAVLAIAAGFFASKIRWGNPQTAPSPTPIQQQAPKLTISGVSPQHPTYVISQDFSISSPLPSYQIATPLNVETLLPTITKLFNFSSSPTKILGSKGQYYLWSESGKTLTVGGNPIEVSYTAPASQSSKLQPDMTYVPIATTFLTKFSALFGSLQPTFVSESFLSLVGEDPTVVETKSEATVDLINYSLSLENHPILSRSANLESVSVGLSSNGTVTSCRFYLFPLFSKLSSLYIIKSYDEAKTSLLSNEGVLLSFYFLGSDPKKENRIVQSDTPPSTSSVTNVQLGYYFDAITNELIPAYFFFGTGKDNQGDLVSTVTAVSAGK